MHWGVDSYGPADRQVTVPDALRRAGDDDTPVTLLDFVARRMGRVPEFWGRYLNRQLPYVRGSRSVASPANSHSITPREVEFLHSRGCRVLLVYNGSAGRRDRMHGGYGDGHEAAVRADAICDRLSVPAHVTIYADVENWPGDAGWFRGWSETMQAAGRKCGVYGRPIRVVENPADGSRHYGTELRHIRSRFARETAASLLADATRTSGGTPRRVTVGEYWSDELRTAMADERADTTRSPHAFYIWSSEPRRVMSVSTDVGLDGGDIPTEFVPAEPPGAAGVRTVVWQYLENALFLGERHGAVDMNMANAAGLRGMW